MTDAVISSQIQAQWQQHLESLQTMLGLPVVLCAVGKASEGYAKRSVASSLYHTDYAGLLSQYMSVAVSELQKQQYVSLRYNREQVMVDPSISEDATTICGVAVNWPSHAQYGVVAALSEQGPLSAPQQLMLESVALRLEKELSVIYQTNQQRYQAELAHTLGHHQAPIFQDFIDSFSDHLWVKDLNGVYTYCNQQAAKVWDLKHHEIIGRTDDDLFDQEIADKFRVADERVLAKGEQLVVEEYANVNDTSNNTWLETIKTPLFDSSREVVGIIGMTRNVTNRKVVEEQLMLAGTVFENSVEGVIITDKAGNIVYVNKAFCDITGYSEIEAVGRNPRFLKSGRHDREFYDVMWQSITSTGKWQGEIWNRRKDGGLFPELATVSVVYNEQKEVCNYVAVFADISQQKQSEAILTHMAYHDPLTDLPNRLKLISQIDHEIQRVKRHSGQFATIFIDIDHFKHINDTYGHLIGDEVLCELAKRLTSSVREEDTVSRIGGDEFVVLMPALMKIASVRRVVSKLMAIFHKPVKLSIGEKIRLTGSLGIALYPGHGEDSDTLLRNADTAMYRAKQSRNDYSYYTESLTRESETHLKLQSAMHDALENDGFHLVYQPQIDIATGALSGFEALIRWDHPVHGPIAPIDFIPVAESVGLIHELGHWVLKTACEQGVNWQKAGYQFGRIAVNVAGQQLQRASFVDEVEQVLHETGLEARHLELEVTESFMMRDPEKSIQYLKALQALGIELAMDDFGTGYSSLSYLQRLPLNKIKIDRSFVANLPQSSHDVAIVDAVIALGKAMSLTVIAEGVETREQVNFIQQHGCVQAQGYFYGHPENPDRLIPLLKASRK